MRIHTLEATGGLTYAQMGRFTAKPGTPAKFTDGHGGTSIDTYAALDPKTQQPVDNGLRNLWVTETALTTALNTSYMAEQISLFGIVVGIALLLAGIGFANPRNRRSAPQQGAVLRPRDEADEHRATPSPRRSRRSPLHDRRAASGRPVRYCSSSPWSRA